MASHEILYVGPFVITINKYEEHYLELRYLVEVMTLRILIQNYTLYIPIYSCSYSSAICVSVSVHQFFMFPAQM